jgi:hypothetical protein
MGTTAAAADTPPLTQVATTPKLVLFITIDQFRGDYPSGRTGVQARPQAPDGRRRLVHNGFRTTPLPKRRRATPAARCRAAFLQHRHPRQFHRRLGPGSPLVTGLNGSGRVTESLQGTTLYDWLAARISLRALSMKDRGAILPSAARSGMCIGTRRTDPSTSVYYRSALPDWVTAFNARRLRSTM